MTTAVEVPRRIADLVASLDDEGLKGTLQDLVKAKAIAETAARRAVMDAAINHVLDVLSSRHKP